jgi:hypothetical protein
MSTRSKKPKRTETSPDWRKAYMVAVSDMNFVRASLAESNRIVAGLREIERKQQERIAELEGDVARLNRENLAQSEIIAKRDSDQVKRDIQIVDLRAEVECGDELIARQRQHCIRLARIKNASLMLIGELQALSSTSPDRFAFEIDGTGWFQVKDAARAWRSSQALSEQIAALEVDSAVGEK